MWISERAAQRGKFDWGEIAVGLVSLGGIRPGVEVDGEQRTARLVSGGAVYVPETEDEVLVLKDSEGESFVLGKALESVSSETNRGEILISLGKGSHMLLKRDGTLELSGEVFINGTTHIDGELFVNGEAFEKPLPPEE